MRKWLIALAALMALSCVPEDTCRSPFGEGGSIDLSLPEFSALRNPGGSLTLNRGYRGIFVTRISYSDFVAFECACPNDNEVRLLPDEEWGSSVLTCPVCHSQYNALDGSPLSNAVSPCMLYQYAAWFDGQILTIS